MSRLAVRLTSSAALPAGTPAAAEVLDASLQPVDRFVVVAGEVTVRQIPDGEYALRVELPSGSVLEQRVEIAHDSATAELGLRTPVSSARRGLFMRMSEWLRLSATHIGTETYGGLVWEHDPRTGWRRGAEVRLGDEPADVEAAEGGSRVLAYSGEGPVPELISLPPGSVQVGVAGQTPQVRLANATAEAISAYLRNGRLDLSATLVDDVLQHEPAGKPDTSLETLVGYHLIRTSDFNRLSEWRTRHREGAALPDQLVVEAWSRLREGDRAAARSTILRVRAAGPPVYREGLRLLLDALLLLESKDPAKPDREVAAVLEWTRDYALANDWSSTLTTFPAAHPDEPESTSRLSGAESKPWAKPQSDSLAFSEQRLRDLLTAHAVLAAVVTVVLVAGIGAGWFGTTAAAVALGALLTVLSLLGAADVRRFGWLSLILAAGYLVLICAGILAWLTQGEHSVSVFGLGVPAAIALPIWLGLSAGLMVLLYSWGVTAARHTSDLLVLDPVAFAGLVALAEVLVEVGPATLSAEAVARNVDRYLARLRTESSAAILWALVTVTAFPLRRLKPPLPVLEPDARKRLLEDAIGRVAPGAPRGLQAKILLASQLIYLGFYGDPRARSTGLSETVPQPARSIGPSEHAPAAPLRPLAVPPRGGRRGYDVIVVGSGPAGAVVAQRMAESGRRVLIVERGRHVPPCQPDDDARSAVPPFPEPEALQMTADLRLQVLQGVCLGGGSVLSYGAAMPPPDSALEQWVRNGIDASSIRAALAKAQEGLEFLPDPRAERDPLEVGLNAAGLEARTVGGVANLSVLDTLLPKAQHEFPDLIEVLAGCEVRRIVTDGGRATAVAGRHESGMDVLIPAPKIIVAGGAIASSWLLRRSGLGGDAAGSGLHFNLSCDLTGEFPEPQEFIDEGLAIVYQRPEHDGYLIERRAYRPTMQALSMPGWFDQHAANMHRRSHMAHLAILVGTTEAGRVGATRRAPVIERSIDGADVARLAEGLPVAGHALLGAGAIRVMPSTFSWRCYRSVTELEALQPKEIAGDLRLRSTHPQGGNAIGSVVDETFRVRGSQNVYVCDASVFPSSVGVEPQLAVMAIAHMAATGIIGE